MSKLPIENLGFKTSQPERIPHYANDLVDWYSNLLSTEKEQGKELTDKQIINNLLRNFYSDPSYRAKIIARHEGCILIEVLRWLDLTKQAMNNHLWLISQSHADYIKV